MSSQTELQIEYVVDEHGNKRAVIVEYELWEELIARLEDMEDALEMRQLRERREESISWEQAIGQRPADTDEKVAGRRWQVAGGR